MGEVIQFPYGREDPPKVATLRAGGAQTSGATVHSICPRCRQRIEGAHDQVHVCPARRS